MIQSTIGVILRTRPLTETSLIVCWLTPDLGRLSTVAKGARRPKSEFRGKLDLFYQGAFSFSRSSRSELHTLREVKLQQTQSALRRDLDRLQQAAYAALLVEQVTETETPLPGVHDLVVNLLEYLAALPVEGSTILAFELKLLEELGLQPDLEQSKLTPGSRALANALLRGEWSTLPHLRLSSAQSAELDRFLGGFILHHLGRVPKGRAAALGTHLLQRAPNPAE